MSEQQICTDLATPPLEWDKPFRAPHHNAKNVTVATDPYAACAGSHAIAVTTEWDEFKGFDWIKIYSSMVKPAYLFDGRSEPNLGMSSKILKFAVCRGRGVHVSSAAGITLFTSCMWAGWPRGLMLILSALLCRNCLDHNVLRDLGFIVVRHLAMCLSGGMGIPPNPHDHLVMHAPAWNACCV